MLRNLCIFNTNTTRQTATKNNTDNRVLLLLSRVSHLHDCQPVLASQDVLSVILEFFLASGPTNIHCFEVLGRLFSNPHCFQDCLLNLAPSLIFHHMTHYSTHEIIPTSEVEPSQHPFVSQMEMCQQLLDKLAHVACRVPLWSGGYCSHAITRRQSRSHCQLTCAYIVRKVSDNNLAKPASSFKRMEAGYVRLMSRYIACFEIKFQTIKTYIYIYMFFLLDLMWFVRRCY